LGNFSPEKSNDKSSHGIWPGGLMNQRLRTINLVFFFY